MDHKQVKICINDEYVEVDKDIADLIQLLNDWDFSTNNSCQDNLGDIWVCFNYMFEVEKMMQIILKDHTENIINGNYDTLFDYLTSSKWTINFIEDCVLDPYKEDYVKGTGVLQTSISLRFPKEDLNKVKKLFKKIFN